LNYRPFYIQGEVKNAGEYTYSNGLLVRDAIAKAGGYTYRASTNYVYIRHAAEHEEKRYALDTPVYVIPGDNIRIDERFF
jgi:polysaccharide export outer membrane protein